MNSKAILGLRVVLLLIAVFMGYKIYRIIMEPIEFERLQKRRYTAVQSQLEKLRDAELAFKTEMGTYTGDLNSLLAFVDTGKITIVERKDSSFMYFNRLYQKEMNKDTTITRILGYEPVKNNLFGNDFDVESLRYIAFSNEVPFEVGAGTIERNNVEVPVFEIKAPNTAIFADKMKTYDQFIDKDYALQVGSLSEPTISGNWK